MNPGVLLTNTQTADWFLNLTFHSLFILIIGWLASKISRGFSAPLRSGITLSTMAVLFFLPFCSLIFQPQKVRIFESSITSVPMAGTAYRENMDGKMASPRGQSLKGTAVDDLGESTGTGNVKNADKETKPLINLSKADLTRLINGFGIIWLSGFLLISSRFFYGMVTLFRFRSGLIKVQDVRLEGIIPLLRKMFKRTKFPPVYISLDIGGPITVGFMNPSIIIPHDLYQRIRDDEIESILLHEMSHIHHRDQVIGMLQGIVTALNWWNPLVYSVSREFSRAREYISDNYAIRGKNPRRYARCLVNLARKTNLSRMQPAALGMAAPQITLEERIKSIISKERIMKTKLKKSNTFLFIFGSFLLTAFIVSNSWTFASEMGQEVDQPREVDKPVSSLPSASVEEMFRAVKEGDTGRINMLLEKNPGLLNARNKSGLTPLFWSLDLSLGEVAKFLVDRGADINIRGFRNRTMLHMAARAGDYGVIKVLLEKGAAVNIRDSWGEMPLHLLCRTRDEFVESAQLLIKKGADVNAKDNKGKTPLVIALYGGKKNIARFFIENGADVNAKAPGKKYLIRETGDGYDLEINGKKTFKFGKKYFEVGEEGEVKEEDLKKVISLVSLLLSDSKDFYRVVKKNGGTLDEQALEEISALKKVERGNTKGTYYKLVINGKVNSFVRKEQLNKKTLRKILQSMAEFNEILLNKAIISGYNGIAKLLIKKGVDINAIDRKGNKPLYYAKKYNRKEIADLLIARGAQ